MRKRPLLYALACLAILFTVIGSAYAQGTTSRVTGTVSDSSGAVVPGATVTLTNEGTNVSLTTETNNSGAYVFDLIQPGRYTVSVEKAGFNKFITTRNTVLVNQPATVNVSLNVGDVSVVVSVESSAEQVQTSSSGNIGTTIEERTIESLPIVGTRGRNPLELLNFQPGVTVGANTGGGVHVHGSRDRAFNFTLDGIDINESTFGGSNSTPLKPNPEAIREFQIVTSNTTAELGRSSGAQVTFVTRSGTNEFHGNIFEYYQTPRFNANSYSNNVNGVARGQFVQHIFGGSVGGPILDPGFGEGRPIRWLRDKAFFFVNLQLLRAADSVGVTRIVYTPQARAGLFRYVVGGQNAPTGGGTAPSIDSSGNAVYPACTGSPATNQPCISSYNAVTQAPNTIDPYLHGLINSMPLPNNWSTGDGLNTAGFSWATSGKERNMDFVTKIDYIANEKNAFYVRYGYGNQDSLGDGVNGGRPIFPNSPRLVDTFRSPRNLAANWRFSPTPKFTNEFIWGRSTYGFSFDTPEPDPAYIFGFLNVSNFNGNTTFNARDVLTYQFVDNMTFDFSPHTLKAGINFRLVKHVDDRQGVAGANINGSIPLSNLSSRFTAYGLPLAGPNSINSNDEPRLRSMLSDLIGHVGTMTRAFVLDPSDPSRFAPGGTRWINEAHYDEFDFYIQDSWRIRPNFLVDVGARWEIKLKPSVNGRPILVPDQPVKVGAPPSNTLKWVEGDLFDSAWGLIMPSVGFAWDPFKKGKTSIRANYRMATDRFPTFLFGSNIFQSTPGNNIGSSNAAYGQGGGLLRNAAPEFNALFPASSPDTLRQPTAFGSTSLTVIDPDLTYPQVHSFVASFQHEFGGNVFEFNAIRKQAVHLSGGYNVNQSHLDKIDSRCPNETFLQAFVAAQANNASCLVPLFRRTTGAQYTLATFRTEFNTALLNNNVASVASTLALRTGSGSLTSAGFSPFFFKNYPQFSGGLNVIDSSDYSKYWAYEFILKRRLSAGLSFQASYTLSKSKDNRSFDPTQTTVSTGNAQSASSTPFNIFDRSLNYSWSDFDRRHVVQSFWVWELPFGQRRKFRTGKSVFDYAIGGWQLSGTFRLQSGRPFTVYSGFNTSTDIVQSLANCNNCSRDLGQHVLENGRNFWFDASDRALFSNPAPGENGNIPRNYFLAPSYWETDLSLLRKFRLTERWSLDIRVDATNAFNHPVLAAPTATASSTLFGRINADVQNTARRVQWSAKLNF